MSMPLDQIIESTLESTDLDPETVQHIVTTAYQKGFSDALSENSYNNPDIAINIYNSQRIDDVFDQWYCQSPLENLDEKIVDKLRILFRRTFALDYESINELICHHDGPCA